MKKNKLILIIIVVILAFFLFHEKTDFLNKDKEFYRAEDFNIDVVKSISDKDKDGIDDYTDIMLGARIDAENHVLYKSAYYEGGYPPEDEGVCADLIWRAFKNAGYILKDMIDEDIRNHPNDYPGLDIVYGEKIIQPDIDFRRVRNLKVFFDKYATSLTLDTDALSEWQPGDIVIFGEFYTHIGIISDKRNKNGLPYLIHNSGQEGEREEDALLFRKEQDGITGHYRFEGE